MGGFWYNEHMVKKSGFSIIEVIIVIVVIGILTAIVAVSYGGVTKQARDSSRRAAGARVHISFTDRPKANYRN